MTKRKSMTLILLWALSLIIVGAFAHAQSPAQRNNGPAPTILSGNDIGFRVERGDRKSVAGTLVVRVNGEWVPAEFTAKVY
jgi:hypothetical protein